MKFGEAKEWIEFLQMQEERIDELEKALEKADTENKRLKAIIASEYFFSSILKL